MDVTDVPYVLQPNAANIGCAATQRLTLQHFDNDDPIISMNAPHNSDARISNSAEWPSDLVFDVSYGCAALKQWGDPTFITTIRDNINRGRGGGRGRGRGKGRGRGRGRGRGAGRGGSGSGSGGVTTRAMAKDQARTMDTQNDYADVVLALWTQNATKHQRQTEAKKADKTRDEVQKWLDSPQNLV